MNETINAFFQKPILNSPYAYPELHWELDDSGQPTQKIMESRRMAEFVMPIPKPKGRKQTSLDFGDPEGLSTENQRYEIARINAVRRQVDAWRKLPQNEWKVMPETARLLEHWRNHKFASIRPFFCQVEAAETIIWLTEVAPQLGKAGEQLLAELDAANNEANPGINRLALKLATGAGKTTAAKTAKAPAAKKVAKPKAPRKAAVGTLKPSASLAAVIGDGTYARTEVVKKIWDYIKANNLQDPADKRSIKADGKLQAVFGKDQATMFELAGIIGKHLS